MQLKTKIILLSLLFLIGLIEGCRTTKAIHSISDVDIFNIPINSKVIYPDGSQKEIVKDGRFFSEYYIEEVIKIKLEN